MISISALFAYAGPDTFLPLTSALSAVAGVVMFFWSRGPRTILASLAARMRLRTRPETPPRGTWRGPHARAETAEPNRPPTIASNVPHVTTRSTNDVRE